MCRMKGTFRLAVIMVGMMALAGCSGAGSPRSSVELALGPIERVSVPEQVKRPIATYLLPADRIVELVSAEHRLLATCLGRADSTFDESTWAMPSAVQMRKYFQSLVSDDVVRSDLWGFFDPARVSSSGYERADSSLEMLDMPSPPVSDEHLASCMAQTRERLPGNAGAIGLVGIPALPDGGPPVPLTDSRFVAGVAEWSECMHAAGFEYGDPLEAIADLTSRAGGSRQEQIAAASSDVRCKVETNLVGIGAAVQAAYDQEYIDHHREDLDRRQTAIDAFLRDAASSS